MTAPVAVAVTAAIAACLAAAITTTPEIVTLAIVSTALFLAASLVSGLVVLVFSWTPWMRALSPMRQNVIIWVVAASVSGAVSFLPLAVWTFKR